MNKESLSISTSSSRLSRKLKRRQDKREKVIFINVYNLKDFNGCNSIFGSAGLGIYHSALQVGRYEFAYGGNSARADSGIYITAPRRN